MLVLSSSEPNSLVYIETAELDGETNLKVRQPVPQTSEMGEDEEELSGFDGSYMYMYLQYSVSHHPGKYIHVPSRGFVIVT